MLNIIFFYSLSLYKLFFNFSMSYNYIMLHASLFLYSLHPNELFINLLIWDSYVILLVSYFL